MRVALAQLNPLVGDLIGNGEKILGLCRDAFNQGADLILTPELSLWGYPPKDLLFNPVLLDKQQQVLDSLAKDLSSQAPTLALLIGVVEQVNDNQLPRLFNAIALVESNCWRVISRKQLLPTYDVFDEKRYFRPFKSPAILERTIRGKKWQIGITICEDLWVEEELQGNRIAGPDPIAELVPKQIDLLINLSASPFSHSKEALRQQLATKAIERLRCPMIYLNQVGGNDELIFDGASFVLNAQTHKVLTLPSCQEALEIWDATLMKTKTITTLPVPEEQLFRALVLGLHDYAHKCGFNTGLIGLSGGIDSALVAVIASAAFGAHKVTSALMPSPWSSAESTKDAMNLANRLGMITYTLPITRLMKSFDTALEKPLGKCPEGITAENLQSRIRGTLLMALANQQGHLLLATGNKSELAVGYCTLYGDMNGGLAVIGDLYKTHVFELCEWLNSRASTNCREIMGLPTSESLIGNSILTKPPSAELKPGQLDSDSLPDYELLDPILKSLIEDRTHPDELIKNGYNSSLIKEVQGLLRRGEFKRLQAPPLLKVSHQAFGSGWRIPIAAK